MTATSSIKKESSNLIDNLQSVSMTSLATASKILAGTQEERKAQKELAKSEQAAKEAANKIARQGKIQEIAGKYLEGRLDSMLDDSLNSVWTALGIDDEEVRKRAKALIRGYITAESELNADIIAAKMDISKELTRCVEEQAKNLSSVAESEINKGIKTFDSYVKKLDDYTEKFDKETSRIEKQIDNALSKTSAWTDDKSIAAIDKFIDGLNTSVTHKLGNISERIDNSINNNPMMKQLGISFKSEKLLGKTFESIEQKIASPLEKKLKPYLQENVQKITSTVTYVNKRIADIKNAEDMIKNEIKAQEEIAKQFAETKLKELAGDIASKINISVGGLSGGLGGFNF